MPRCPARHRPHPERYSLFAATSCFTCSAICLYGGAWLAPSRCVASIVLYHLSYINYNKSAEEGNT